jgi:hypothetical protein
MLYKLQIYGSIVSTRKLGRDSMQRNKGFKQLKIKARNNKTSLFFCPKVSSPGFKEPLFAFGWLYFIGA